MLGEVEVLYSLTRVSSAYVESIEASLFALRKLDFLSMLAEFPEIQAQVKKVPDEAARYDLIPPPPPIPRLSES